MNKIQFKYIPVGGYLSDVPAYPKKYKKISKDEVRYVLFGETNNISNVASGTSWYSDYELVAFKDVKPGEHIWYFNAGKDKLETYEYIKVNDAQMSNAKLVSDSSVFGLFWADDLTVVHRPAAPVKESTMTLNWINKDNLCKLEDLKIGDQCILQGGSLLHTSTKFTVDENYSARSIQNPHAQLVILVDEQGEKHFANSTQQVYRKPKAPPQLMLSTLKTGQYFTFKGETKEYIKMAPPVAYNTFYYRDAQNQLYVSVIDREVDPYIPF